MGSSFSSIVKYLFIPTAIAALPLIASAMGIMEMGKDELDMVAFWSDIVGTPIPPKFFFGFVATAKLIGNAAFWGFLPKWYRVTIITSAFCAGYMHYNNVPEGSSGNTIAGVAFGCMGLYSLMVSDESDGGGKKDK